MLPAPAEERRFNLRPAAQRTFERGRPPLYTGKEQRAERARRDARHDAGRKTRMKFVTRRSVLRGSAGLAAAGVFARPYVANAAATTATVWWIQGFAQEEDIAFKKIADDYNKATGNTLDYSIIPYAPMRQKIVSAITSGAVPDLFQ